MPVEACSENPPLSSVGIPHAYSITSSPRATSPSASESTLPCSAVRQPRDVLAMRVEQLADRKKSSARRASDTARHDCERRLRALHGASTSSTEAKSTAPVCTPVAGLKTGPLRPDVPATRAPPIQWVIVDRSSRAGGGRLGELGHR